MVAQWLKNLTRNLEVGGLVPGPWSCSVGWGSGVAVSCGVGCRQGSDPLLLWLWCRLAATAPIGSLAWEPRSGPRKGKNKKKKKKTETDSWI